MRAGWRGLSLMKEQRRLWRSMQPSLRPRPMPWNRARSAKDTTDECLVAGRINFVRADPMRLQPMRLLDPLHRAQRDANRLGHGSASPVRGLTRRFATGERHHAFHRFGGDRRLARLPRLVAQQPVRTLLGKTLLPAPHHRTADAELRRNALHRATFRRRQDHLRPRNVFALTIAVSHDRCQPLAIRRPKRRCILSEPSAQTRTTRGTCESAHCIRTLALFGESKEMQKGRRPPILVDVCRQNWPYAR